MDQKEQQHESRRGEIPTEPFLSHNLCIHAHFHQERFILTLLSNNNTITSTARMLPVTKQEAQLLPRDHATRAVSVKTVLNVAQMFIELHLISPALGE